VGEHPGIERIKIENFGCIQQVEFSLCPLHALIGPNDSGKSTLLRAIRASEPTFYSSWFATEEELPSHYESNEARLLAQVEEALGRKVLLRLDPDALRVATKLLPTSDEGLWFLDEKGHGLAGLYDALLGRDRRAFIELEDRFIQLFPTVKALRLDNADQTSKALGLTLRDGKTVRSSGMSEGMLYWLAFAIIEHLSPVGVLLIEEPENGLHPSRIREVMQVLRKVSEQTQIVLATHSPLVINELRPEEVTLVTRTPERGTICTPMTQTKNFKQRSEVYALGELWLSYADGNFEKELVGDATEAAEE
jgi:predicted ATPase